MNAQSKIQNLKNNSLTIQFFSFRGLARDGKSSQDAFRIWYYRLDQLRSIMRHVPFIALSATVTSTSKLKICSLWSFNNSNTHSVVKSSPLKGNIKFSVTYVEKSKLEEIFDNYILFKKKHSQLSSYINHLSITQTSLTLYKHFKASLGRDSYASPTPDVRKRRVAMFQRKSPPPVKEHIIEDMTNPNGNIVYFRLWHGCVKNN